MSFNLFSDDLIIGSHSIFHALQNKRRTSKNLIATDEGIAQFCKKQKISKSAIESMVTELNIVSQNEFNRITQNFYNEQGFEYSRIPGSCLLVAAPLARLDMINYLEEQKKIKGKKVVLALDQVTDIHNAAAIMRTAAFYKVDFLIIEYGGNFRATPGFFRIASGATEFVAIYPVKSLIGAIKKIKALEIPVVGLSEESDQEFSKELVEKLDLVCMVFGAEEAGLSHAVERVLDYNLNLGYQPMAAINSLNVSIAVAVTLERLRGHQ